LLLASDRRSAASCYRAHSGLSPPSYRPCWAHPEGSQGARTIRTPH
jgi:hypothetical protein